MAGQSDTAQQNTDDDATNSSDATSSTDSAADDRRAGTDLTREDLEKALGKARDESARYRKKAQFAFEDEESYRRANDALSMLDKVEADKKSTEERLTERNEQLMYRASTSERDLLRLRVALKQGIDVDRVDEFASRLRGDTEDEMTADAEHLARFFAPAKPERRGDPSQGAGAESRPVGNPLQAALEAKIGLSR